MIQVTLYTRKGCHLCDEVRELLDELKLEFPHELLAIDIDEDHLLKTSYGDQIPIVIIGEFVLKAPISVHELRMALQSVVNQSDNMGDQAKSNISGQGRFYESKGGSNEPVNGLSKSDKFSFWLSKHYLALINFFVIVFLGLPVLAPVFMKIGWTTPATIIYRAYSITCHQLAYRSFFLFGEQSYYPREVASIPGVKSYYEETRMGEGNSPDEIIEARNFVGNEQTGYKIALCQRDIAIYTGILSFNLIFALSGRRIKPLNWILWILIGLVPIGIDGMSQLISQPPLSLLPFRESIPLFRVITGFLFGLTTAWFGIPHIEASMVDSREMLEYKKTNLQKGA